MALNPNIPLSARASDLSQLGQSVSRGISDSLRIKQTRQQGQLSEQQGRLNEQRGQLNEQQILQNNFKALDEEKQRMTRLFVHEAVNIKSFVDSNDDEAIELFLIDRINRLDESNINSKDTQKELQDFRDDPDLFKSNVKNAVNIGRTLGILPTQSASNLAGGATGIIIDRLRAENPDLSVSDALFQIQTGNRQGIRIEDGRAVPIKGLSGARSKIIESAAEAKETGKQKARLKLAPSVEKAIATAKIIGKEDGINETELRSRIAQFPRLLDVTEKLRDLSKIATYTKVGQAAAIARRELGLPVGKGAVARTEFQAIIDNEILPLLRQTFGAQFTEKEGRDLKATLGDVNKSPEEKSKTLSAFMATKAGEIETLGRQIETQTPEQIEEFIRRINSPETSATLNPGQLSTTSSTPSSEFKIIRIR